MPQIDRSDIVRSIKGKGFRPMSCEGNPDHDYYVLVVNGIESGIVAKISRGSRYKTYSTTLLNLQARVWHVKMREVYEFFECSMKLDQFLRVLRAVGWRI